MVIIFRQSLGFGVIAKACKNAHDDDDDDDDADAESSETRVQMTLRACALNTLQIDSHKFYHVWWLICCCCWCCCHFFYRLNICRCSDTLQIFRFNFSPDDYRTHTHACTNPIYMHMNSENQAQQNSENAVLCSKKK